MTSYQENSLSVKTRVLRRMPGLSRYYDAIARLDAERIASIASLNASRDAQHRACEQAAQERDAALSLAHAHETERDAQLRAYEHAAKERDEALTLAHAHETERDAQRRAYEQAAQERDEALTLAHAHETERDAQRRVYEQAAQERDEALTLAHAHETERDAQRRAYEQATQERDAALALARSNKAARDSALLEINRLSEERAAGLAREDAVLKRLGAGQDAVIAKLDLASATILGLGVRQEEAMARLRRGLMGKASRVGQSMTVDLYLDLLEASLTGLLMEDGSQAPWTKESFDPNLRSIGRDWPTSALTMIGTARMRNLRMLTLRALDENVPGDFIETGVWRGGACIYMKGILAARGEQGRQVFVADSFKGLPPPDEASYPADAGDQHHTFKALAVSRDAVEASFRRYGLMDDGVTFLEGWFKDTLPAAPIERLAVLRLDGDMYESTMDALKALYHKVSPGGFVIIDDYILPACARAVEDFRAERTIRAAMETVDGAAVWWQVSH
jgi:O-methyltransferase